MALTHIEQFITLITDASHILIAAPEGGNNGTLPASLALARLISALSPKTIGEAVCAGVATTPFFSFLPDIAKIHDTPSHVATLTITVATDDKGTIQCIHKNSENMCTITLTPTYGAITREEVIIKEQQHPYNLIITLGASDLASLGPLFTNHTALFQTTPIINIDVAPNNERYGALAMVNVGHGAIAAILMELFENAGAIDKDTATLLLSSIVSETDNFRKGNITPSLLECAAKLLECSADHKGIMKHLYYNRSVQSLKLWGETLGRLMHNKEHKLVWCALSRDIFYVSKTDERELLSISDELLRQTQDAEVVAILFEDIHKAHTPVRMLLSCTHRFDARVLVTMCEGEKTATRALCHFMDTTLSEAAETMIPKLISALEQYKNH